MNWPQGTLIAGVAGLGALAGYGFSGPGLGIALALVFAITFSFQRVRSLMKDVLSWVFSLAP